MARFEIPRSSAWVDSTDLHRTVPPIPGEPKRYFGRLLCPIAMAIHPNGEYLLVQGGYNEWQSLTRIGLKGAEDEVFTCPYPMRFDTLARGCHCEHISISPCGTYAVYCYNIGIVDAVDLVVRPQRPLSSPLTTGMMDEFASWFSKFDTDGSRTISPSELRKICDKASDDDIQQLFDQLDANGNRELGAS